MSETDDFVQMRLGEKTEEKTTKKVSHSMRLEKFAAISVKNICHPEDEGGEGGLARVIGGIEVI
jgi:hypothetical protein